MRLTRKRPLRTALRPLVPTLACLVGLAVAPTAAHAQAAEQFGRGHLIVSADRLMGLFSYGSQTITTEQNGTKTESSTSGPGISILLGGNRARDLVHNIPRVSVDYALEMGLTIGGSLPIAIGLGGTEETRVGGVARSVDAPTTTIIGFAPCVGYVIHLSDTFSFWPRAGIAYYSASEKRTFFDNSNAETTQTRTTSVFSLDLDPQFVITPFPHFGVTVGPLVNIPVAGSVEDETKTGATRLTVDRDSSIFHFGINAGLLGYF